MKISLIVAASPDNVIGRDGGLPWHLPEDLQRFKALTMGKPIVMGRLTHESIGRPLPGRRNIVISRRPGYRADGCDVVASPEEALRTAGGADEVMIIGGAAIYRAFLPRADRIYLTRVNADVAGDVHFPALPAGEWTVVEDASFAPGPGREFGFSFQVLERAGR